MRQSALSPQFVEYIPERLNEGALYISERYATAVHLCCCGCGEEVVTPLTPADWQLRRDGDAVSLQPSIGNWSFACRSHYWIKRNRVEWAGAMTQREIELVRRRDLRDKARYIEETNAKKFANRESAVPVAVPLGAPVLDRLWRVFRRWLGI